MAIEGHIDFREWDERDNQEFLAILRSFTINDVFLAVEMTEQTLYGTSAMQRWYRLYQCVHAGIPTILAVPGRGSYTAFSGLGTRGTTAQEQWLLTNETVLRFIRENRAITREDIQAEVGQEFVTEGHNNAEHLVPDMLTLWDTFETPMCVHFLPEAYPFVCDQYAWSGTQLQTLWDLISPCIDAAREGNEVRPVLRPFRQAMWDLVQDRNYGNSRQYNEMCASTQFPQSHKICIGANPTNPAHHRSFRGHFNARNCAGGGSSIVDLEWAGVLNHINNSRENYQQNLNALEDLDRMDWLKTLLARRNQLIVYRCNLTHVHHTNYKFNGPRFDIIYTRVGIGGDSLGVSRSPYARHAIYVLQVDLSLADFANSPESTKEQYGTADLLSLNDGLYPGKLWWPREVVSYSQLIPICEVVR